MQVLAGQNPKLFSQKESDAKEAAKQAARKAAGEAGEKAASNSAKEYINKAKKAKKGFFPKDCKLSAKVEKEILSDAASACKNAGQDATKHLPQSWSTRTLLKRMRQKLERKLQQMPSPSQSNDVGVALFQRVADKVIIDEYSKVSLALVVEVKVLG